MSIPTPSFWKIRKYLIIVILIIYCFVIGSIKQAFGVENSKVVCLTTSNKGFNWFNPHSDPGYVVTPSGLQLSTIEPDTYSGIWYENTYAMYSCDSQTQTYTPVGQSKTAWQKTPCLTETNPTGTQCELPCPQGEEETA